MTLDRGDKIVGAVVLALVVAAVLAALFIGGDQKNNVTICGLSTLGKGYDCIQAEVKGQ